MPPPEPKKKRPPRKRKKKNALSPVPSASVTPAPSENGETSHVGGKPDEGASKPTAEISSNKAPQPSVGTAVISKEPKAQPVKAQPTQQPQKQPEKAVWESVSTKKKHSRNVIVQGTQGPRGAPRRSQQQASSRNIRGGRIEHQMQSQNKNHPNAKPQSNATRPQSNTAMPPYRPAPGSWAAKLHKEQNGASAAESRQGTSRSDRVGDPSTNRNPTLASREMESPLASWARQKTSRSAQESGRRQQAYQTQDETGTDQRRSGNLPSTHPGGMDNPSPSGDWRSHSLARNSSNSMRSLKSDNDHSWPTLAGEQARRDSNASQASSTKQSTAKGAWAARLKK